MVRRVLCIDLNHRAVFIFPIVNNVYSSMPLRTKVCHFFSPYSTKKQVRVGYSTQVKLTETKCKPNSRIPNANHIPLACIGARVGHCRLTLGIIDSRWALLACVRGVGFGLQGFLDTNMMVKRNCRVGGLNQCEAPTRVVSRCNGI